MSEQLGKFVVQCRYGGEGMPWVKIAQFDGLNTAKAFISRRQDNNCNHRVIKTELVWNEKDKQKKTNKENAIVYQDADYYTLNFKDNVLEEGTAAASLL